LTENLLDSRKEKTKHYGIKKPEKQIWKVKDIPVF
jgi:hypothetical protein